MANFILSANLKYCKDSPLKLIESKNCFVQEVKSVLFYLCCYYYINSKLHKLFSS